MAKAKSLHLVKMNGDHQEEKQEANLVRPGDTYA